MNKFENLARNAIGLDSMKAHVISKEATPFTDLESKLTGEAADELAEKDKVIAELKDERDIAMHNLKVIKELLSEEE